MFAFTSLIPIFLFNVSNFRQNEGISRLLTGCWFCTTAVAGAAEKKVKAKFGLKYLAHCKETVDICSLIFRFLKHFKHIKWN